MICNNCGAQIEPGTAFCIRCGTPVPKDPGSVSVGGPSPVDSDKKGSGKVVAIISIIAVILICAIVVIIFLSTRKKQVTVDLNQFLKTQNIFYGYDSKGYLDRENLFDRKAFLDEMKKIRGEDYREGAFDDYDYNYEKIKLSKEDALSNGDVIKLSWVDIDPEYYKETFGITFTYADTDITVSGLAQIQVVDVFKDVDVSFDGVSGAGEAYVYIGESTYLSNVQVNISDTEYLSNGDTVTVSFDADDFAAVNGEGVEPDSCEKSYEVSGLTEYVTEAYQIDDYMLEKLQDSVKSTYDYDMGGCVADCSLEGYVGCYVTSDSYSEDRVYVLYKACAEYKKYNRTYYVAYSFDNVYIKNGEMYWNGSCEQVETNTIFFQYGRDYYDYETYYGFSSADEFKDGYLGYDYTEVV